MNEEIQVLYNEKKVLLSDKIIEKIKYLYKKEKDLITNEMDMDEFSWIIEKIISNCKFTIKRHLLEKNNQ